MARKQHKKAYRIGPYSHPTRIAKVDRRTREGKVMHQIAQALREHVGDPSVPEQMIIETTAFLWVQVNLLAPRVMEGSASSDLGDRQVLAYINQLKRNLETLGLKPEGKGEPRLRDLLGQE